MLYSTSALGGLMSSGVVGVGVDTSQPQPCKVLHFRNVNPEITQEELVSVCTPFGAVEKVIMMKSKKQAMVQMHEISAAINFVTHHINVPIKIGGKTVYASFSKHQELTTETANKILLVTFFNALHAQLGDALMTLISVNFVHQIFSSYGVVQKIVMMNKDAVLPNISHHSSLPPHFALVQFTSIDEAIRAKSILSGYSFYAGPEVGSFTIDTQFSNLHELTVRQASDRARDFTTPAVPLGVLNLQQMNTPALVARTILYNQQQTQQQLQAAAAAAQVTSKLSGSSAVSAIMTAALSRPGELDFIPVDTPQKFELATEPIHPPQPQPSSGNTENIKAEPLASKPDPKASQSTQPQQEPSSTHHEASPGTITQHTIKSEKEPPKSDSNSSATTSTSTQDKTSSPIHSPPSAGTTTSSTSNSKDKERPTDRKRGKDSLSPPRPQSHNNSVPDTPKQCIQPQPSDIQPTGPKEKKPRTSATTGGDTTTSATPKPPSSASPSPNPHSE
ncbi:polypyrimidine tract-binding protein 3 [Pelomyxa schiedti]|nr:polypyrimidine tract-binding protein 3 [Pelomyxa schiedti]